MTDNRLAVTTIKNSVLNIASFIIGLLVNVFLVRYVVSEIGIEYYGISALLLLIIAPLTLANLGFGEATTKYVAEHMHQGNKELAAAYVRTTFFMNLTVGTCGALLIYFAGPAIFMWAFSDQITADKTQLIAACLKLIAFGWIFNQCSATFMSIPIAMQQFTKVAAGNIIYVICGAILTVIFMRSGMGLTGYVAATVGAQFFALMFWLYSSKQVFQGISLMPRIDKTAWKNSVHFGGWQTLSQLGGIIAQQSEKYVLGVNLPTAAVGIYNVVLGNIQQKIYAIVHKLAEVLFPLFSAISNDEESRKANILIKSTWITTTLSVCLLTSVIPFAHNLIELIMKNKEVADKGEHVLRILCIGGAFGSATTAGYFFLLGIGKTIKITYISLLTGIITIVVAAYSIPRFGLIAAGFGPLAGAIVQSMAISRVMRTALKDTIKLSSIITTIYVPIITGCITGMSVWYLLPYSHMGWVNFIGNYILMNTITAVIIFIVTRILPHGKEHEKLIYKLISHTWTKLKMRFN
jgi:O-antigen/teichoic acid export membrane protein